MKITKEDAEFIKANYKGVSHKRMIELLLEHSGNKYGRTNIQRFYKTNGLHSGLDGRFKKGHKPVACFQKGFANLNEEQIARIKATQYKKGNVPKNLKEVGTVTKRKHFGNTEYSWIKLGDKKRQLEHDYVWEKAHGKMPPGGRIIHVDGDSHNNKLENLMLIDNAELGMLNHIGLTDDVELNKTIVYTTKLMKKLKEWYDC